MSCSGNLDELVRTSESCLLRGFCLLAAMAVALLLRFPFVVLVRGREGLYAADFCWQRISPEPVVVKGLVCRQAGLGI